MRRATDKDRPAIEAFLQENAAVLMFPWSNLIRYGMNGGHPRAMSFWVGGDDRLTDLLGVTDEGMIMPYLPHATSDVAPLLAGRQVAGLLGDVPTVARIRAQLGLGPAKLDVIEPHFQLALKDMRLPRTDGLTLWPLAQAPRDTLIAWRAAYGVESLALEGKVSMTKAFGDIASYIANNTHRVLMAADAPVAMTGFNATAPGIVQIGGVYTPPPLRSRGYARAAVALHLAEARAQGVETAILFAANPAAAKAYTAIGFQQIGTFAVAVYETPQEV